MPSGFACSSCSQTTAPVSLSYARSIRSCELARNTRPPAVATGPFLGRTVPVFMMPCAASPGALPSGTRHLMTPSLRSYATSCVQGGPIAGSPLLAYQPAENDPEYRDAGPE